MRPTGTTTALVPSTVAVILASTTPALCLAAAVFLAAFCGIALPAVWSTKPARRRAATAVLDRLLNAVRRPRSL